MAGLPGYARYVGTTLSKLPDNSSLPWYQVINSQKNQLSAGSDTYERQIKRLENEGVVVKEGKISMKNLSLETLTSRAAKTKCRYRKMHATFTHCSTVIAGETSSKIHVFKIFFQRLHGDRRFRTSDEKKNSVPFENIHVQYSSISRHFASHLPTPRFCIARKPYQML